MYPFFFPFYFLVLVVATADLQHQIVLLVDLFDFVVPTLQLVLDLLLELK
jgi:hypothetical protein